MSRSIRFNPEGGALVEVTDRTAQARLLLGPSWELNEIVIGVLGRAQRLYKRPCYASKHGEDLTAIHASGESGRRTPHGGGVAAC